MLEHFRKTPPEDVQQRFRPTLYPIFLEDPEDTRRLYCLTYGAYMERLQPDEPFERMRAHPALARMFASMEDLISPSGSFMSSLMAKHVGDLYQLEHTYPLLSSELLDALASFIGDRRVLDAGAGLGTLSHLLKGRGASIVASDTDGWYPPILERRLDHVGDSIAMLPGDFDVVLLSWPPHKRPFGHSVVKAMRSGQVLIHMGEFGGCTGDAKLERELQSDRWEHQSDATAEINRYALQIFGLHDRWDVFLKL